jgi:hypothetical protein
MEFDIVYEKFKIISCHNNRVACLQQMQCVARLQQMQ